MWKSSWSGHLKSGLRTYLPLGEGVPAIHMPAAEDK